jgi:hypothetical protein
MSYFCGRLLLLIAALPLALPHGWCCLLLPRTAPVTAAKPVALCPHCRAAAAENPVCPNAPPSKPCPGDPFRCPCGDRASTAPEVFKAFPDISKALGCDLSVFAANAATAASDPTIHYSVPRSAALPIADLVISLRHFLI